jgi:hypothetical protein
MFFLTQRNAEVFAEERREIGSIWGMFYRIGEINGNNIVNDYGGAF